jgi:acetyltransferase
MSLEQFLQPTSIVVIGASNDLTRIGAQILANLKARFTGDLIAVHPGGRSIQGQPTFRSVREVERRLDCVIVAVRADLVPDIVEECAALGASGALIVTSGFAESGPSGVTLQRRLLDISQRTGIRLLGPNCTGFLNAAVGVAANFSLRPQDETWPNGGAALVTQSGGFGTYVLTQARTTGLRLGWFISTGNEVDLHVSEALDYLVERSETTVLLASVETIRDFAQFERVAARAAELDKPVVLINSGRSAESTRAVMSHTASVAGSAEVLNSVCRQLGVMTVDTIEELLDFGLIFQAGRRTTGTRTGILTTTGGAGILLADACGDNGLSVPQLPSSEQRDVRRLMSEPFYGSTENPVDTTAQIGHVGPVYRQILEALAESRTVDLLAPVLMGPVPDRVNAIIDVNRSTAKPLAVTAVVRIEELEDAGVPSFPDPYRSISALAAVVAYSSRPRPLGVTMTRRVDTGRRERALSLLAQESGARTLLEPTAKRLLALYGIPVTSEALAATEEDAVAAGEAIGYPVALKVVSHDIIHKSDVGGVRLDVYAEDQLRVAYHELLRDVRHSMPAAAIQGVLVQRMVAARLELACGITRDPIVGAVVAIGMGGVLVELLRQTCFLRPPFDIPVARQAIAGLVGGRLLSAPRGLRSPEVEAVAAVLVQLGVLAEEIHEIDELDINPLRVASGSAIAADALVLVRRDPA